MLGRRILEKLDLLVRGISAVVAGQQRIERKLRIMSQAELELAAKADQLLAQNDALLSAVTTLKTELDAAVANGSDPATIQAISAKFDVEIAKNAAALAALAPATPQASPPAGDQSPPAAPATDVASS